MAAPEIARVIADVRDGNYRLSNLPGKQFSDEEAVEILGFTAQRATVVDVTAIYRAYMGTSGPQNFYDDHPMLAPPWPSAIYAFENQFGNVYVMMQEAFEANDPLFPEGLPRWEDNKGIDWDHDVRWVLDTKVWVGGKSGGGRRLETSGPNFQLEWALGHEGQPLDLHWRVLNRAFYEEITEGNDPSENALISVPMAVLMDAVGFLNCRNIEVVEPKRVNHERKRVARTGVTLNEIHVFPAGKTSRSKGAKGEPIGSVHAPVRGHFAEYGERFGKGKLFGKLEGRFYIPPHVRGSKDVGESQQEFTLRTDA